MSWRVIFSEFRVGSRKCRREFSGPANFTIRSESETGNPEQLCKEHRICLSKGAVNNRTAQLLRLRHKEGINQTETHSFTASYKRAYIFRQEHERTHKISFLSPDLIHVEMNSENDWDR